MAFLVLIIRSNDCCLDIDVKGFAGVKLWNFVLSVHTNKHPTDGTNRFPVPLIYGFCFALFVV